MAKDSVHRKGEGWVNYRRQTVKLQIREGLEPRILEAIHLLSTATINLMLASRANEVDLLKAAFKKTTEKPRVLAAELLALHRKSEPIDPDNIQFYSWEMLPEAAGMRLEIIYRRQVDGVSHNHDYRLELRGEVLFWELLRVEG